MADLLCSICEKRIYRGWYCYHCYNDYYEDIVAKKEWTMGLQRMEKRRRRTPTINFIYLGDKYDISDSGALVLREGYYGR